MSEELKRELVRLTYSPEIVNFELSRKQGLEILNEIERINKAIEYIENNIKNSTSMDLDEICDVLDILKGVDK